MSKEVSKGKGNKKKRRLKKIYRFILLVLVASVFGLICEIFIKSSIDTNNNGSMISYNEKGNIDYKLYLNNNNQYLEKFLTKGSYDKYVAEVINTINVNFNYELHSTEVLNYEYKYTITADLVITDKNDNKLVLNRKKETLVNGITKQLADNDFIISKDVDIDYDKYNDYVKKYKKEFANISVNGTLNIIMDIEVDGSHDESESKLNSNKQLRIIIPLNEATFAITLDPLELNYSNTLTGANTSTIKDIDLFIVGIASGVVAIALLVAATFLYFKEPRDVYKSTIKKILREYDRIIVESKAIEEIGADNVIVVDSIEELIDAHDTTGQPILYYEVIPNQKCYFLIIDNETLYKLVITRSSLERIKEIVNI